MHVFPRTKSVSQLITLVDRSLMAFAEWFNTTFPNACAITFFSIAAWTILLWLIGLIPKLRTLLHYCMPIGAKHFGKYKGYAFITGGASGIGAETARFLAKQGRDLYLCDYNPETLEKVKARFTL